MPLVYFDVTVKNAQSTQVVVSTAFSWQDVISRNIFDATTAQLDLCYPNNTGPATCALDVNQLMSCIRGRSSAPRSCELNGRTRCSDMARVPTSALPLTIGESLAGVEQRASAGHLSPNKLTMQQYNNRVAVLVEKEDGDEVSLLTSYAPSQNSSDSSAVAAWRQWATSGRFPSSFARGHAEAEPLYRAPGGGEAASAVALRMTLAPGASRTVRFVVVWHAQEVSAAGRTDNRTVCGTTDHNRMYHNRFAGPKGLESLVSYATAPAVRSALRAGTTEWHLPVLASTMPSFLQFTLRRQRSKQAFSRTGWM